MCYDVGVLELNPLGGVVRINGTTAATVNSNVASATKLQTARTIWGRSFDGTGNVTGNISNTGNITPSATIAHNIGTSSLMYEKAYIRRIDTQSGYDLRLNVAGSERMIINTSGNVGIGTTSPAYKLDVSGTGRFTGNVTAPTFIGALSGNAGTATALTTNAGSATQPVYFSGGKPVVTKFSLGKSVPSTAVFTDTH